MEIPEELRAITKPILKQAVYSIMYGMHASNAEGYVTLEFSGQTLKGGHHAELCVKKRLFKDGLLR